MRFIITCPCCFMDHLKQFGNSFECNNCGEIFELADADFSEDEE